MSLQSRSEMKELSSIERELSILIPWDALKTETDRAYQRLSQKVRMKGFRPGKAPRQVLEQYYRADVEQEVLNNLLEKSYKDAVAFHAIEPLSQPAIETDSKFSSGNDFSYKAKVEVRPLITLTKWKGLEVSVPKNVIGDKQVQAKLDALLESHTTIVPVTDRQDVLQGDLVECKISAAVDGNHVKSLSSLSKTIEVGSGKFFPEVEQALVGKKVGDHFEVKTTISSDYKDENLREKEVVFSLSVESLRTKQVPALDDDFAKDVSEEFETLEALKASIVKSLEEEKVRQDEDNKEEAVLSALIESNPFDVPSSLVDFQAENMAMNFFKHLPRQEAKKLWQQMGAQFKTELRPKALRVVQASLLLEAIAAEQNIHASEEALTQEFEKEATRLKVSVSELRSRYKPENIADMKHRLAHEGALKKVLESAHVKSIEG